MWCKGYWGESKLQPDCVPGIWPWASISFWGSWLPQLEGLSCPFWLEGGMSLRVLGRVQQVKRPCSCLVLNLPTGTSSLYIYKNAYISMQYFKILSNCLLIKSIHEEVSHFLLWSLFCRVQLPLIYIPEAKPCSFSFTCSFLMKNLQLSSETSLWVRKGYRGVWKVVRNTIWLWFCLYHQNDQKIASTTQGPLMVNPNDCWSRMAHYVRSTMLLLMKWVPRSTHMCLLWAELRPPQIHILKP